MITSPQKPKKIRGLNVQLKVHTKSYQKNLQNFQNDKLAHLHQTLITNIFDNKQQKRIDGIFQQPLSAYKASSPQRKSFKQDKKQYSKENNKSHVQQKLQPKIQINVIPKYPELTNSDKFELQDDGFNQNYLNELLNKRHYDINPVSHKKIDSKDGSVKLMKTQSFIEQIKQVGPKTQHLDISRCKIDTSYISGQGQECEQVTKGKDSIIQLYCKSYNNKIMNTISIAYVPNTRFQRFKNKSSSNKSYNLVLLELDNDVIQDFPIMPQNVLDNQRTYLKLLQIRSVKIKNQTLKKRSLDLNKRNKEIVQDYKKQERDLQTLQSKIKNHQIDFQNKQKQQNSIIQNLKFTINILKDQIAKKQKSNSNYLNLNEQLVKQINNLKAKNKQLTKIIQSIKYEMSQKKQVNEENHKKRAYQNTPISNKNMKKNQVRFYGDKQTSNNNILQNVFAEYQQKEENTHSQIITLRQNQYGIDPYLLDNIKSNKNNTFIQPTLISYKSHQNIHKEAVTSSKNTNEEVKSQIKSQIRSQKSGVIRKNIESPKANQINDGWIQAARSEVDEKLKNHKSQSNFSNNSSKSLTQKIGFVAKAPKPTGVFFDYMLSMNGPQPKILEKGLQKKGMTQKNKLQLKSRNHIQI